MPHLDVDDLPGAAIATMGAGVVRSRQDQLGDATGRGGLVVIWNLGMESHQVHVSATYFRGWMPTVHTVHTA